MSKCDIKIELDRHDHLYRVGDTVRVVVYVSVSDDVKCDGLTLTNMWKTHGRGNIDKEDILTEELFKGEWQAGEYNYSYSFEIKEGPLTYHGHYINIDRYINVRADIPWAIDPKAEIEYIVEKGTQLADNQSEINERSKSQQLLINKLSSIGLISKYSTSHDPMKFFIPGIALSLLLTTIGALILYSVFFTENSSGDVILAIILCVIGLFIGIKMINKKILHGKLGLVIFKVQPSSLRATDETKIKFEFTPNTDIEVNHITFSLIGTESATSGSGTNRSTATHEFHNTEQELLRKGIFMRGMPVMERAFFEIPSNAPHTFNSYNNRISWSIRATMDINNSPDWHRVEMLEIII